MESWPPYATDARTRERSKTAGMAVHGVVVVGGSGAAGVRVLGGAWLVVVEPSIVVVDN